MVTLVILTELRTGGGAFLVIQYLCNKKRERKTNNTDNNTNNDNKKKRRKKNCINKNNIKHTKYWWAAGFMNINQVVFIRSNWFAEIKPGTIIGERQPMRLSFVH